MQHATAQPKTRVGKQRRQFRRQQRPLPAAAAGFSLPARLFLHEQREVEGEGAGPAVTGAPGARPEPVAISWWWDAAEHGEPWRLIHPPSNHEAAPLVRGPR